MKLQIEYTIKNDSFNIDGDFDHSAYEEVIDTYLRGCMGEGVKENEPKAINRDIYTLQLDVDLTNDSFKFSHNCGNQGLALGLLIAVLKKL